MWLANLEVSAGILSSMLRQPAIPRHPHPDGPTPMTSQLLDSSTQLEATYRDRDLSRMLKGVVTDTHCLTKFSREGGSEKKSDS